MYLVLCAILIEKKYFFLNFIEHRTVVKVKQQNTAVIIILCALYFKYETLYFIVKF